MKQGCIKITIVVRGPEDESSLEESLTQAVEKILDGCIEGADSSDNAAFYFKTSKEVPKGEWPS